MGFFTIKWSRGKVVMLDQLKLPGREVYLTLATAEQVAGAIKKMNIRGAPAIGVAAAMGLALSLDSEKIPHPGFATPLPRAGEGKGVRAAQMRKEAAVRKRFEAACAFMAATRPTAVNLFWAIERMKSVFETHASEPISALRRILREESQRILDEDVASCRKMGAIGARFVPDGAVILTHCNAGALATAGYGTALGVIRAAHESGKRVSVYADETRPYLQGARLTAWELQKDGIPVTLITDSMAGHFIKSGKIDLAIVGADRIASNGDTANKIGTYSVSVLAKEHKIPFYVAAPLSTIDLKLKTGADIPIEERSVNEVILINGKRIAPKGVKAAHPAFDVTPAKNITAIFTEAGVAMPPNRKTISELFKKR